jgi:tetratricopeptide (TPR) repeat protein
MQPPMLNTRFRAIFLACSLALALSACASKEERANEHYVKAQQLAQAGQMAEAKVELMRAVAIREDAPDIWFALGQLRLATGEMPEAFTAFGRADELRPGDANTLRPLAYTGYMIGATRLAKDANDRLLALNPSDPQGLAVSGMMALDKGEPEVAIAEADKILATTPTDQSAILLKARAIAVKGGVGEAIKLLREAKTTPETQTGLNMALLQFYRANGDVAGMKSLFPSLIEAQKDNVELALDYANLLYRTGDLTNARKIWADAVIKRRDDAKFVAWAFELFDNMEPESQAVWLDERLTKLAGSPLRSAAGQYLITRKDYAGALALITQGGGAAVNDRGLQAVALDGLGRRGEAEALVTTILSDTGGAQDPNALLLRAKWAIPTGKIDRAAADAQGATIADPSNLAARLVTAQAYTAAEQPLRVRQVLAQAVRDLPRSRRALMAYLNFLQGQGDHDSAIAAARNFADANTAQPWGWMTLANTCQKINDGGCVISAKKRYDASLRDYNFSNPSRPFKMRGLFSPLPSA